MGGVVVWTGLWSWWNFGCNFGCNFGGVEEVYRRRRGGAEDGMEKGS